MLHNKLNPKTLNRPAYPNKHDLAPRVYHLKVFALKTLDSKPETLNLKP